jgi:hypothetical protein
MRLETRAFALAAGTAAAVAYTICALAVAIAPVETTAFLGFITHTDLSTLARPISWGAFIGGVVAWWIIVAAVFGLAAWFYNCLVAGWLGFVALGRPVERQV